MNIIGFHKGCNITLVEQDGTYFVADKQEKKVLYKGDYEACNKVFVMIIAGFIEKEALS